MFYSLFRLTQLFVFVIKEFSYIRINISNKKMRIRKPNIEDIKIYF